MTDYEKKNAASLLALVNDYIVALHKVGTLARENEMIRLETEVENVLPYMEKRARELHREISGGVLTDDSTAGNKETQ